MKRVSFLILLFLSLQLPVRLMSDIVEPGDIYRQFKITNIKDFPDYRFYILYTNHYYEMGYQEAGVDTVWVFQNSVYATSDRGATSSLFAVKKGSPGIPFQSEMRLGGEEFVPSERIATVIDVVDIKAIKEGAIVLESRKEIWVYKGGKQKVKKKKEAGLGFISGEGPGANTNFLFWLLPVISLLMLIAFWFWRKRQIRGIAPGAWAPQGS
jgi:hypothetical protein